ncbi:MAG: dUTP diphosphatase [Promethearchaeota archaeon]
MVEIKIKKWSEDARLPTKAHKDDAGYDCYIRAFKEIVIDEGQGLRELKELNIEEYELGTLERVGCALGFATVIPEGYYAAVVPRSGNALWKGLSIVNTPGTIDSGYRNEWMAIVINLSNTKIKIKKGDKICQFIIRKLPDVELKVIDNLEESERGLKGFGSSENR